jgi:hypothetical protein
MPILSTDDLVNAWLDINGFTNFEGSPFPSGESPRSAISRWYSEHLQLEVVAPNSFTWQCTGCHLPVAVESETLHLAAPYDHEFWELCPRCRLTMHDEDS